MHAVKDEEITFGRGLRVLLFRDWLEQILISHGGKDVSSGSSFEDGTVGRLVIRAPDGTLIEVRCRIMEE